MMIRVLTILLLALAALPSHAWWNAEWSFRKKLVLNTSDTGVAIKESLVQVPVAVRLHGGNFTFADAKEDGSDLRFVAGDDKTPLRHRVEVFDPVNELAILWVQVPKLGPGAAQETVWLYFGNGKAAAVADAKGVYDAGHTVVLDFDEKEGTPRDATGHGNHVTAMSGAARAAALLGGGLVLDGKGRLVVPASPSLKLTAGGGFTFAAWMRQAQPQSATLFAQVDGPRSIVVSIEGDRLAARIAGAQGKPVEVRGGAVAPGKWTHVAMTLGAGKVTLFVNGEPVGDVAATPAETAGEISLGAGADGRNAFAGELDAVQVSSVARSPDWLRVAAGSQGEEARLLSFGDEEQGAGGGTSHFTLLVQSLTVDAIVVIAILAVMMVMSFLVMVLKLVSLARTNRANHAFLEHFERAAGDPAALSEATGDAFDTSTVWRLHERGRRELVQRLERLRGAGKPEVLTVQSLSAIRAAMDAALVRENHRLNAQMVLLTICISGGPFLGLLGTVAGVMITFTGIAAAGDVNINAIAPGMAAALLATIAGLAVAIPCLFGYNYLGTRIKAISADTHVFVDEYMSTLAERYAG